MSRTIKCLLCVLIFIACCNPRVSGQEQSRRRESKPAETKRDDNAEMKQRQQAMQRRRRARVVELKDPADFLKEGQERIFSGPQVGESVTGFHVIGLSEKREDEKFDPIEEVGDKPMVLIFQDDTPGGIRGLLGLSRAISAVREKSGKELQLVNVFLDDDSSKISEFSKRFRGYLQEVATISVSPDGRDGPGAYGLNRNVTMTVLLVKDKKVVRNFVFPQSMLYPDPHVMGGVAELIGEKRETVAKWFVDVAEKQEQMRQQRQPQQQRRAQQQRQAQQ